MPVKESLKPDYLFKSNLCGGVVVAIVKLRINAPALEHLLGPAIQLFVTNRSNAVFAL